MRKANSIMINKDLNILYVIPARGGSKRLKNKNIYVVNGKPSIIHTIDAVLDSKYVYCGSMKNNIVITTESDKIKICVINNCCNYDDFKKINVIDRPDELAKDDVWRQEVLKHAVDKFERDNNVRCDIVVTLQANSPEIEGVHIDLAIDKLIENNLYECVSVDSDFITDGAIRVMKRDCVWQEALSCYLGFIVTDYIDVHYVEDIISIESKYN